MTDRQPPASPPTVPAAPPATAGRNRHPTPRLSSLEDVRRELARLYREARHGDIPAQVATRLCYLLDRLAALIAVGDLERRIEELERQHADHERL
jgi:hypothetical protein